MFNIERIILGLIILRILIYIRFILIINFNSTFDIKQICIFNNKYLILNLYF